MTQPDTDAFTSSDPPAQLSPAKRSHRHRRGATAAVTASVLLVGAGGVAYAISTGSDQQKHRHFVTVLLDPDVTTEQRAVVQEKLEAFDPIVGPDFRGSGAITSLAAEIYQDNPEALERAADMALPAMIVMTVESPVFDCEPVPALLQLPGVHDIMIDGVAEPGGRFRRIVCP